MKTRQNDPVAMARLNELMAHGWEILARQFERDEKPG